MSLPQLTILLNTQTTPSLIAEIQEISPDARIITADDIEADPSLIEQIEIVFGRLGREHFPQASRLRWLQTTFAGMEWANQPEVRLHPATLTNARIHAAPISEHLFGLLLMLTRGLHLSYQSQLSRVWDGDPSRDFVEELPGKTLCVVGLGEIGRRCAMLGEAHGMRVIGVRRHPQPTAHVTQVYAAEELQKALSQADVVMVVLPNTPDTRKLIDSQAFAAMKRGSLFLNAGRGQTVDTEALVAALRNGTLKGAGLDVVDPEPLPSDHPLWQMPNVILTPHYSGSHPNYDKHAAETFLANLRRYVAGEPLVWVIDKESGY